MTEITARVIKAVETLQASTSTMFLPDDPDDLGVEARPHSTMISFAEPTHDNSAAELGV